MCKVFSYLVVKEGTKTRKCPYCNRVNKVVDTYRAKFNTQEEARTYTFNYDQYKKSNTQTSFIENYLVAKGFKKDYTNRNGVALIPEYDREKIYAIAEES